MFFTGYLYFPVFLSVAAIILPLGLMGLALTREGAEQRHLTPHELIHMALIFFSISVPAWCIYAAPYWWAATTLTIFVFIVALAYSHMDVMEEVCGWDGKFPTSGYFIYASLFASTAWLSVVYYWMIASVAGAPHPGVLPWTA